MQQLALEGKLGAVATERGQRRILFRRDEVERLRAERGVGRHGRTKILRIDHRLVSRHRPPDHRAVVVAGLAYR